MLLVLGASDVLQFLTLDLSSTATFRLWVDSLDWGALVKAGAIALVLTVLVPCSLACLVCVAGVSVRPGRWVAARRASVVVLHVLAAIAISIMHSVGSAMETISGFQGFEGDRFDHLSLLRAGAFWSIAVATVAPIVTAVVSVVLRRILGGDDDREALKMWRRSYARRLRLLDIAGDLRLRYSPSWLNLNAGAIAPEIRGLRREAALEARRYQRLVPGSRAAETCVLKLAERTRKALRDLGHEWRDHGSGSVELYPSTSRALEVAVAAGLKARAVVVSPWEHPSTVAAMNWLMRPMGVKVHHATPLQEHWEHPESQVQAFIDQVTKVTNLAHGRITVVLSEVHYATGMILPIRELVDAACAANERLRPRFVIDGAHVPGNVKSAAPTDAIDAYVYSAHKWLLSPEPAGIVIRQAAEVRAYDGWSDHASDAAWSVRTLASVLVAVENMRRLTLAEVMGRVGAVHDDVVRCLGREVAVVAKESRWKRSGMFAVAPAPGFKWACAGRELEAYLAGKTTSARVFTVRRWGDAESSGEWLFCVRVAMPFFSDDGACKRAAQVLSQAVMESH